MLLTCLILILFEYFVDDIRFLIHWSNFLLLLKQKIISVFERIFSTALKLLLDDRPLLLALTLQHYLQQFFILILVPWSFLDSWVEIATPMFPTLLRSSENLLLGTLLIEPLRNRLPALRSYLCYNSMHERIFLLGPLMLSQLELLQTHKFEHAAPCSRSWYHSWESFPIWFCLW